jgi:RNAse (barnase) inhibitor barstar
MPPFNIVTIDTSLIDNWEDFHTIFAKVMGFPDFYGRNMNAWIDCMTYIDDPDDTMTTIHAPVNGVLVLNLEWMSTFRKRCPEIAKAIEECSAFVNHRRIEVGDPPILVLSYS